MVAFKKSLIVLALVTVAMAQAPEPPISDSRLSIHTLVREDIFAGFLQNDMKSLVRGERTLDQLLEKRPAARAELLAWKGGATLYRAVLDLERKDMAGYKQKSTAAFDLFAEARKLSPQNQGVFAVIGGTLVVFTDRLAKEDRTAAWAMGYDAFHVLWKSQEANVDKFPVHIRGELLAGLAQTSQRTGRIDEMNVYLDKILALLGSTPYEGIARQWKKNPASAGDSTMACMTCHEPGRLAARINSLNAKPPSN